MKTKKMTYKLNKEQMQSLVLKGLIRLKDREKIIKQDAFRGCLKLETLVVPASVKMIEQDAFVNCVNLKKLIFEGTIPVYKSGAFRGCKNIQVVDSMYPKTLPKEDCEDYKNIVKIMFGVSDKVIVRDPYNDGKEME